MNIKTIFLMLIFSSISLLNVQAAVENGKTAPNFALTDTMGKAHTLSAYRGKFVVLEWTNPDCPFVKKHYDSGNIPNLQKKYTANGVVWFSIDSSAKGKEGYYSTSELNDVMKKKGWNATALFTDSDGKVGKMYGAQTTPHIFIIDPNGTLIYQGAIDSTPSTDREDISKSQNYVESALNEAMNGRSVSTPMTKSYGCSVKY